MHLSTSTSDWRRTVVGAALGLLAFVIACELLFRLLPVSTATKTNYDIDPALLTYPPHHNWRMATGWDLRNAQRLRSNNVGFAAEIDFVPDPEALALVGDSYVEASMLPAADRPAAQLQGFLGGTRKVYAMGAPGSSLLDYAERIRFARERFGVRNFVILMEAGDVRQALCGSGNIHSACLERQTFAPRVERLPEANALKRVLRESALAQYLKGQLKLDDGRLLRDVFDRPPASGAAMPARDQAATTSGEAPAFVDVVTRIFFERVESHIADGKMTIVVDGQRGSHGKRDQALEAERARFIVLARAHGVHIVDAETVYGHHFAGSSLSLDVGPYDAHLNALGVQLVMSAAARAVR